MWPIYSSRKTLPGKGPPPQKKKNARCQLHAKSVPLQLWHSWPLTQFHSHLPSPTREGCKKTAYGPLWPSCLVTLHSNATQEVTLYSLIELPIFFPNKPHVYRQLISSLCWVLCQIQGDRQGQIPLYSPHLALTPVTRVSGRGSEFHAGCTICPLFTLPSICITDSRSEWH